MTASIPTTSWDVPWGQCPEGPGLQTVTHDLRLTFDRFHPKRPSVSAPQDEDALQWDATASKSKFNENSCNTEGGQRSSDADCRLLNTAIERAVSRNSWQ